MSKKSISVVIVALFITSSLPLQAASQSARTERTERHNRTEVRSTTLPTIVTATLTSPTNPNASAKSTRAQSTVSTAAVSSAAVEIPRSTLRVREERESRVSARFSESEILVKRAGATRFERIPKPATESVERMIARLQNDPGIEYAEPNYIAYTQEVPNDQYYGLQWNFDNAVTGGVHAEAAWDVTDGSGITVAIIDTGVAYENYNQGFFNRYYRAPELAGTSFAQGYDFANGDTHANDDNGHGTHVAGTIAQTTNNSAGVTGLAYGAKIMPIKALDRNGSGTYADIADAIIFAADNDADVINLSLGGSAGSSALEDAISYAYNRGVTIVAAAGNNGANGVLYPAAYDQYVIAVGATRYDETKASYSNYGTSLDIMAPGGDTSVDQNGDGYPDGILQQTFGNSTNDWGYYFYQGTSMATPHVAAAAALVLANKNATTPAEVRAVLESSADDLGVNGRDNTYGHGLLNLSAALSTSEPDAVEPDPTEDGEDSVPEPEPNPSPTPQVLFFDSFENGEGNWTQDTQHDWRINDRRATDGENSYEVDGRTNNGTITSIPINLQGNSSVEVSFSMYLERSFDSGEYIAFAVSTDGGNTWNEMARLRGNIDRENRWYDMSFDLNNISDLQLRFYASASSGSEDADVDEVLVMSTP